MTTIHFVYAGHPDNGIKRSPHCITHNLYYYLKNKIEPNGSIKYYDWAQTGSIDYSEDDIIIGHPHYGEDTIIQQSIKNPKKCKGKFTLHPFHSRETSANYPFDCLIPHVNAYFAITGKYWYDTINETVFSHWRDKIVRLDMAVDANQYQYTKRSFNQKRKLLYIGSDTIYKNLGYMLEIVKNMNTELHWYGGYLEHPLAKLPNVRTTGNIDLNHENAIKICNDCDLMINTSHSDANPTTLLEVACWGIPVACTKGSGYYNNDPFYEIPEDNVNSAVEKLNQILQKSEEELLEKGRENRSIMEQQYNWTRFCNKIWSVVSSCL